jgi:hypothetical protein
MPVPQTGFKLLIRRTQSIGANIVAQLLINVPLGSRTKAVKLTRGGLTVGVPGGLPIMLELRAGRGEELADRLGDASDSD